MRFVILSLVLLIGGCAANPYGNFLDQEGQYSIIASDVLEKLNAEYPPAHTKFSLIQEIDKKDSFGNHLISEMRTQGYGIQEFSEDEAPTGTTLAYTLDQVEEFYRVTLYINGERLSRPYLIESGSVTPGGSWSLSLMEVSDE